MFFSFQFLPPHSSVLHFASLPLLQQAKTNVTCHRSFGFFFFSGGAIVKRKTMTAGGYIDLNIFSVKTCSSLSFLWTVQQGCTVTKHMCLDRNYVFPCNECNNMHDFHEVYHDKSDFCMYACNLTVRSPCNLFLSTSPGKFYVHLHHNVPVDAFTAL